LPRSRPPFRIFLDDGENEDDVRHAKQADLADARFVILETAIAAPRCDGKT